MCLYYVGKLHIMGAFSSVLHITSCFVLAMNSFVLQSFYMYDCTFFYLQTGLLHLLTNFGI